MKNRLVHLVPKEQLRQSFVYVSSEKWHLIEHRLSIFNIQTGILNCSDIDYSHLCRTLNLERFILLVPSINHRSNYVYSYDIYSIKHYNYQSILKWLRGTLEYHVNKDFDWHELSTHKRSVLEFQIAFLSSLPIYYFSLLYRYGSIIDFRLNFQENTNFEIRFLFQNSNIDTYIYNNKNNSHNFHEFYSYRSLTTFLSFLTINTQTLMYIYFIILNIYVLYDVYLVQSLSLFKKFLIINIMSGLFWFICLIYISTESIDYILQMISFYLIKLSQNSKILMSLRNDLFIYSTISKWMLYSVMIILHVGIGLCFRWYLKEKFGRMLNDVS